MSRFEPNSKAKKLPIEYWKAEADLSAAGGGIDHVYIVGGATVSLFLSMFASPAVGIFVAALIAWSRFKGQHEQGRAGQAIEEDNLIAPFLKGDSFRGYLAFAGHEAVVRELQSAQANKYQLTSDAAYFLRNSQKAPAPGAGPQMPPAGQAPGAQTRLNAIDVCAVPVTSPNPFTSPVQPDVIATPQVTESAELSSLLKLPLKQRAEAVVAKLMEDGFDLVKCIQSQITCICGNQRGGKGTLMAILSILSQAADSTRIHYFTAGDDIYPFKCERLVSRRSYPKLQGDQADGQVANDLLKYLRGMDNAKVGTYKGILLVIDEAVALSDYLSDEDKEWLIRFLLTRTNKKGAQSFIVLHADKLTAWLGTNKTGGFSNTFKQEVTFIGCQKETIKTGLFTSENLATGRYFLAQSADFSKAIEGGELGMIPNWLKSETNPTTGHPDPARTLLNFFPELRDDDQFGMVAQAQRLNKPKPEVTAKASADVPPKEEIDDAPALLDEDALDLDGAGTMESADGEYLKLSDGLAEPLRTIFLFAIKRKDWITPRDIQQKNFKSLKGKDSTKIRQLLGLLSDMGYGEIEVLRESVRFRVRGV